MIAPGWSRIERGEDRGRGRRLLRAERLGHATASRLLRASSPRAHVAKLRQKPVFLSHSTEDRTVPVTASRSLAEAMKLGAPATRLRVVQAGVTTIR